MVDVARAAQALPLRQAPARRVRRVLLNRFEKEFLKQIEFLN